MAPLPLPKQPQKAFLNATPASAPDDGKTVTIGAEHVELLSANRFVNGEARQQFLRGVIKYDDDNKPVLVLTAAGNRFVEGKHNTPTGKEELRWEAGNERSSIRIPVERDADGRWRIGEKGAIKAGDVFRVLRHVDDFGDVKLPEAQRKLDLHLHVLPSVDNTLITSAITRGPATRTEFDEANRGTALQVSNNASFVGVLQSMEDAREITEYGIGHAVNATRGRATQAMTILYLITENVGGLPGKVQGHQSYALGGHPAPMPDGSRGFAVTAVTVEDKTINGGKSIVMPIPPQLGGILIAVDKNGDADAQSMNEVMGKLHAARATLIAQRQFQGQDLPPAPEKAEAPLMLPAMPAGPALPKPRPAGAAQKG